MKSNNKIGQRRRRNERGLFFYCPFDRRFYISVLVVERSSATEAGADKRGGGAAAAKGLGAANGGAAEWVQRCADCGG